MSIATEIAEHARTEHHPDLPGPELLPARLMRATAAVLPVAAAGISAFSRFRYRVPLGASDDTAALAERLQFTVGEGPCLSAHVSMRTVLATAEVMASRWPAFHRELVGHTPYRAIVSIPFSDPALGGEVAMDPYYDKPQLALTARHRTDIVNATAGVMAELAAGSGLDDPLIPGPVWLDSEPVHTRTMVWTAMGMVGVALQLHSPDALAVLRGHAYSHNITIDDIARGLITGELSVDTFDTSTGPPSASHGLHSFRDLIVDHPASVGEPGCAVGSHLSRTRRARRSSEIRSRPGRSPDIATQAVPVTGASRGA